MRMAWVRNLRLGWQRACDLLHQQDHMKTIKRVYLASELSHKFRAPFSKVRMEQAGLWQGTCHKAPARVHLQEQRRREISLETAPLWQIKKKGDKIKGRNYTHALE